MSKFRTNAHEWVAAQTKQPMSELAKHVCDVLVKAGHGGIYNRPINFHNTDWTDKDMISVVWRGSLSNWDWSDLTAIWAHCADKMIRVEIAPHSFRYLRLRFWQRSSREGGMGERLPTAEDQIKWVGVEPQHKDTDHE